MRTIYNPNQSPRIIIIQKLYGNFFNEDKDLSFSGQGSNKYSQQFEGNVKFNCFPNWPADLYQKAEYVSLYPNVMLGIHVDHFYAFFISDDKTSAALIIFSAVRLFCSTCRSSK